MSAARVIVSSVKLGRTAVAANLRGHQLSLAVGESEAFGGVVKGTFGLSRTASGADMKTQMQFANIDLDQSLGEMFGFRRLEGKGNLSFALESSGNSVYELTRGLNGTANLVSRKGAIAGINVEQLLKRMERSPLSRGNEFRSGKTPYDTLNASLKITQGTATIEDIRVEGPTVRLGLVGSASIPDRDLDLRGTASLVSTTPTPAFELPFMVQGAWDDPVMLPDAQSLIERSGAAQPLLDALRKSTARDAIRSAIEKFGVSLPAKCRTNAASAAGDRRQACRRRGIRTGCDRDPAGARAEGRPRRRNPRADPSGFPHRPASCGAAAVGCWVPCAVELAEQRCRHEADGDDGDQDGADRIDLRFHAEPDLRIDADRQRGRARPRGEARDHQIVERERERQHPAGRRWPAR